MNSKGNSTVSVLAVLSSIGPGFESKPPHSILYISVTSVSHDLKLSSGHESCKWFTDIHAGITLA